MSREVFAFRLDPVLYRKFRRVAKERGHAAAWYLEGCMREVVGEKRREVIPATKLFDLKGKPVKPLGKLTKSKRKRKS
jgi:hypothetical protein